MKDRNILIWNSLVFILLSVLIAGFQTSFWPSILRVLSGANLWLFLTVYICIYRNFDQGLIFVYLNTMAVHAFTSLPIGILLSLQIIVLIMCNFLRSRIFWNTASYYLIISIASIVLMEVSFMLLSYFFENSPAQSFAWKETLITIVLTPALGFLFYSLGRFVDSLLPPPQIGATKT